VTRRRVTGREGVCSHLIWAGGKKERSRNLGAGVASHTKQVFHYFFLSKFIRTLRGRMRRGGTNQERFGVSLGMNQDKEMGTVETEVQHKKEHRIFK
jgi:hypothetical protein